MIDNIIDDGVDFQFRRKCEIIRGRLSILGKNHDPPRAIDQTPDGSDWDPRVSWNTSWVLF